MHCNGDYDQEYLVSTLPQTFVKGPLRKHQLSLALIEQKSLLRATLPLVRSMRAAGELEARADQLWTEADEAEDAGDLLYAEELREEAAGLEERSLGIREGEVYGEEADKTVGIWPCTQQDCKGMLNKEGRCSLCSRETCMKCLQPLVDGSPHACKEGNTQTASRLQSTCKPCPACGSLIEKARDGGCDQMWCTQCHTAFSWVSGARLMQGEVHNPHYLQHVRSTRGSLERSLGDLPCGGLCTLESLQGVSRITSEPEKLDYLILVWTMLAERIIGRALPEARLKGEGGPPGQLAKDVGARVDFHLGNIDENTLAKIGLDCSLEKKKWKSVARHLHNYVIMASDRLRAVAEVNLSPGCAAEQLRALTALYNDYLDLTERCYPGRVPRLDPLLS